VVVNVACDQTNPIGIFPGDDETCSGGRVRDGLDDGPSVRPSAQRASTHQPLMRLANRLDVIRK
jgi:hypothetical protein